VILVRTKLTGINAPRTWCGHGDFAHNLVKTKAPWPHEIDTTTNRAFQVQPGADHHHPGEPFFRS
jgi:hypothetical protein